MRLATILVLAAAAPAAIYAAQPSALTKVSGGLWEISGAPGLHKPIQQCVSDVLALAQFEHRAQMCTRNVITDGQRSTRITYDCGPAGFGQTEMEVITPRSLKIRTQGISDQLPFNYVIQAHRVGECENNALPAHH